MTNTEAVSRRDFLQAAAVTAAAPALADAKQRETSSDKIRVGCLSWCFHSFSPSADQEQAVDIIGDLGFDSVELILLARNDIKSYWTEQRIARISRQLERYKLQVSQFVLFQPVVEGLTSIDPSVREQNLDYFEAGCKIGKKLNARLINIVAPWARELKATANSYLPRYYDIDNPKPDQKFHIDVADDFDWDRVWDGFIVAIKGCLERVKAHGQKLTIEHHTHTAVPEAASFLRLWEAVRDPALGYNLDTGWAMINREYPPLAMHKVKGHLMNTHMRDIDGSMRKMIHVGTGVMDHRAIVETAKKIGFSGFMSIEQDKYPGDMKETCQRYLKMMREYLA